MSKIISLKLDDKVFREMCAPASYLKRSFNAYINDAVVSDESMRVLKEFEAIEDAPD